MNPLAKDLPSLEVELLGLLKEFSILIKYCRKVSKTVVQGLFPYFYKACLSCWIFLSDPGDHLFYSLACC